MRAAAASCAVYGIVLLRSALRGQASHAAVATGIAAGLGRSFLKTLDAPKGSVDALALIDAAFASAMLAFHVGSPSAPNALTDSPT
jgi:hypothetical protein